MHETEKGDLDLPEHLDLRQGYLDSIFQPGRFCAQAILKALQVCKVKHQSFL